MKILVKFVYEGVGWHNKNVMRRCPSLFSLDLVMIVYLETFPRNYKIADIVKSPAILAHKGTKVQYCNNCITNSSRVDLLQSTKDWWIETDNDEMEQ